MPVVIYAPHKKSKHDGSNSKKTQAFIHKLFVDDTAPGLHIEPIKTAVDPKVRTGRVDEGLRAVLFKLQSSGGEPHYIFTGVWPHDEAITIAGKSVLRTNPVNGLPELIQSSEVLLSDEVQPAAQISPSVGPKRVFEKLDTGVTLDRLVDLGIDKEIAARAVEATSDDEMMEIAESAAEWQGLALLDLAAGSQIEDVRATYSLEEQEAVEQADETSEEERLLVGIRSKVGQMQFAWIEHDDELAKVIESGDFARWRVFLHPQQRRYVDADYNGPFRLSGGAGTGKTVALLHRTRRLALNDPAARIVLTTFTRNLAESLEHDLWLLDDHLQKAARIGESGVHVTGVDLAANGVLTEASEERRAEAISNVLGSRGNRGVKRQSDNLAAWRTAIATTGDELPAALRSPAFLAAEYEQIVLARRIKDVAEYSRQRRPGRGIALGRVQRSAVWKTIETYRAAAAVEGALDFAEVPNDLFIAEDAQQRIYGQPVVLSRLGINVVGRSRRLTLNYRTTEQVLRFARGILDGAASFDLDDEEATNTGYRSARRGPVPGAQGCKSLTDELDEAAKVLAEWIKEEDDKASIGILVRDQRTVDVVARGLEDRNIGVRQVKRGAPSSSKRPQLMTMHRAKGMEFKRVLIFAANADLLPAKYLLGSVPEDDLPDVIQRERSLFYVAATRARDELMVIWEGSGSEFLPSAA